MECYKIKELCGEVLTQKHQSLAVKCRQPYNLFIRHKIELIKQCIVLGQVLIMVDLLLSTKPHAVDCHQHNSYHIRQCQKCTATKYRKKMPFNAVHSHTMQQTFYGRDTIPVLQLTAIKGNQSSNPNQG